MKNERDYTIVHHLSFKYKFSYDEIELNDYYIDFNLYHGSKPNAVNICDSIELRDRINATWKQTETFMRPSAKIIASNDPELLAQGIPDI